MTKATLSYLIVNSEFNFVGIVLQDITLLAEQRFAEQRWIKGIRMGAPKVNKEVYDTFQTTIIMG